MRIFRYRKPSLSTLRDDFPRRSGRGAELSD